MAARKLQSEIDRTLKKVSEGVELFESIYDKMQSSGNQTQKEKLEIDLKSQIKKLQRLRDQIKTWITSNDIKDKSQLLDNRRLIETQMEKFKACEKEMKTKAFSKEGLIQATKLDPKEQEKEEAVQWLQGQVDELGMQVEQTEAEIEALHGTGKKRGKGSAAAGRQEELEQLNERRKWHISRLEIVLRMLNNGSLSAERVLSLQEDVKYFVESNTEEDFDEDGGIYDELNLDEEEEKFGLAAEDEEDDSDDSDKGSADAPPPRTPKKHNKDDDEVISTKRQESPILKKATLQLRKPSIDVKPPAPPASKPPPNPNFAQQPMSSILKAGLPSAPARPPVTLPPIRYASVVAPQPAVPATPAATATSSVQPPTASTSNTSLPQSTSQDVTLSPSLTHPSIASPMLSSTASLSQQHDGSFYSGQESPQLSEPAPSSTGARAVSQSPKRTTIPTKEPPSEQIPSPPEPPTQVPLNGGSTLQAPAAPTSWPSPLPQQVQQVSLGSSAQAGVPQYPPGMKVPQTEQPTTLLPPSQPATQTQAIGSQRPLSTQAPQRPTAAVPTPAPAAAAFAGLSDLVVSFESIKQKAAMRMNNLDQVNKMLEGGYSSIPQPQDTEKPKYYIPRNPFQTPAYYPQTPHPLLSTVGIFQQLDVETLFYVFYFLPGTYQQYLAAKELKRQSWRFHIKYLTWFQRHSEPQAITEEYEQGVYVYFDWEGSWCQRKKSDFRFEYRYLSEE